MTWCEHCRDHFPESHYERSPEGYDVHKVGVDYGATGALDAEVERLRAEVERLHGLLGKMSRDPARGHYKDCASCSGPEPCDCGWSEVLAFADRP